MDVCSKILSRILSDRLYVLLGKYGTKHQYGATPKKGCQDGSFTLKSVLHSRRQHNLPTYILFVDLIKAYDTADHELLIKLLKQFGAPPKIISVIERLYTDLKIVLNKGVEEAKLLQSIGVRQGDNMSQVLFLFLRAAFAEVLEKEWEEKGISKAVFQRTPFRRIEEGKLMGHSTLESLSWFEIIQMLYLDDGSYVFESREDMQEGAKMIKRFFHIFGLTIHIGKGEVKSKTEFVFFPPPSWFRPKARLENEGDTATAIVKKRKKAKPLSLKKMDEMYDNVEETKRIFVEGGYIDAAKHFKYLGSHTSYHLRDDLNIDRRIAEANKSMGFTRPYFNSVHVDLHSKYLVFMTVPMNLLLWGCELWALKEVHLNRLDDFMHRSIRSILGITIIDVIEDKIKNEMVRCTFSNIPDIRSQIAIGQCKFIGKIVRGPEDHPPKQLLTAWCNNPRLPGRPITTNRVSIVISLQLLLPEEMEGDKCGNLSNWINVATHPKLWAHKIEKLKRPGVDIPEPPNQAPPPNQNPPPITTAPAPTIPPCQQRRRPSSRLRDAYSKLGLNPGASEREVRIKFREISRRYHPDRHQSEVTGFTDGEAVELFQDVNNAQEFLTDHLRTTPTSH